MFSSTTNAEDEQPATGGQKFKYFFSAHWRGIQVLLTPIIACLVLIPQPIAKWQWCAYTLICMASWWVTECMPLPVTAFLPMIVFPLVGVMETDIVARCYLNDTIVVFVASLMLAAAVEQSQLHIRMALCAIRTVGYSHYKLLFAMGMVTMFVSMWITNTAATTMVVPINFALLKVFEDQKMLNIYETVDNNQVAGHFTVLYFCSATYSATIGGIGTLIGTGTNLVLKGLMDAEPGYADVISFPKFSMFTIPVMLLLQLTLYFLLCIQYLGLFRKKSKAAEMAKISPEGMAAAKEVVMRNTKQLGPLTYWECMVLTLFGFAIMLFFSRSPQLFKGWGDTLIAYYGAPKDFIKDSANAMLVVMMMLLLPATLEIFKNYSVKYREDFPGKIHSVVDFIPMDRVLPYSFMFLLGGGFALSKCASKEYSDLNGKIGQILSGLNVLPNALIVLIMIIFTVFLTNFASNVATAYVVVPIGMTLAKKINASPLQYDVACGLAASFCMMLPVGTPGNLIVQSAAKVTTGQMIRCGFFITIATILILWGGVMLWAPVIWPGK